MHSGRHGTDRNVSKATYDHLHKELTAVVSLLDNIVNPKDNITRILHECRHALRLLDQLLTHPDHSVIPISIGGLKALDQHLENAVKLILKTGTRFDDAVVKVHAILVKIRKKIDEIIHSH